jgi:glycosyltransferase involved in cell wall biosynthesis
MNQENNDQLRILYISRAHPPDVGGIEKQNFELGKYLSKVSQIETIINTWGRKFLIPFSIYALIKGVLKAKNNQVILLGDGLLAPIGWLIKKLSKKPVVSVIHGLDITYNKYFYQKLWAKIFIKNLDHLITVSNATKNECIKRSISEEKITFIANGINPETLNGNYDKEALNKILGFDLSNKKIILTLGRLVERKGVYWFIKNVLPKLDENIIYLVAGEGEERNKIEKLVKENKSNTVLLGHISEKDKKILLHNSDIFIQPNIKVKDDIEGFGITVIEAGTCKMTVVASNLEGLKDAIKDEQNGYLLESKNALQFVEKINYLLENKNKKKEFGEKSRAYNIKHYHWKNIAPQYIKTIKQIIKQ